jgi:hypothetical protein
MNPPDGIPTMVGCVNKEADIIGKLGAAAADFKVDKTVARSIAVLLKQAVESGHTFYTAKCSLRQLKSKSSKARAIVLTPCAIADKMTAAYIAVGVFEKESADGMDQSYALMLANTSVCILTLNVVYNTRGDTYRLIYSIATGSEFAKSCNAPSQQRVHPSTTNTYDPESCAMCGKAGELKTCSRCGIARYCDEECQKKDWVTHKRHCAKRPVGERHVVTEESPSVLFTNSLEHVEEYKRRGGTVIDLDF